MVDIVISGNTYFSYASVSDANIYLIPDSNYATWSALTDDAKGAYLIQGTRLLDSLEYKESADTQAERELIDAFSYATILIASLVATGSTAILGGTVAEAQANSYKAGSVSISYFRDISFYFPSSYSAWPKNILALIRPYLKNLTSIGGAVSFGTDGTSPLSDYSIIND